MTDQELIDYFNTATLPETLRIDRATTQVEVKEAVKRNMEAILSNPKDQHARHRLEQIVAALKNPYDGPEIPGR
jgi:predicted component of type VI protein secretion system